MGCGSSKHTKELEELVRNQTMQMERQAQYQKEQDKIMRETARKLEEAAENHKITMREFEEQKLLLIESEKERKKAAREAWQLNEIRDAKYKQEFNETIETVLKKAEEMRRRITPPAKPGKVNILVQTDKTYGPHAVLKRRTPRGPNEIGGDHRDACGGVGMESVAAPALAQIPMMVVKEKDKNKEKADNESDESDEYAYEYEYQYQYQYTDDMPAMTAMIDPKANIPGVAPLKIPQMPAIADTDPLFTKKFSSSRGSRASSGKKRASSSSKRSRNSRASSGVRSQKSAPPPPQECVPAPPAPAKPAPPVKPPADDDEEYEYEYEDED